MAHFEYRGVTLKLLLAIKDEALSKNHDESFWSIGSISSIVIGNHEILKSDSRWGYVDPSTTCTFADQCSLIEVLRSHYSNGVPHPRFKVTYEEVVGEKADIFLSFAYTSNYIEMVDAIEGYILSNGLSPDNTYFWQVILFNTKYYL
jgi:hypothetical protein